MRVLEKAYPYDAEKSGKAAFDCRGSGRRAIPILVIQGSVDEKVLPKASGDVIKQFAQVDDFCDDGQDNDSVAATRLVKDAVAAQPAGQHAYEVSTLTREGKPVLQEVLVTGLGPRLERRRRRSREARRRGEVSLQRSAGTGREPDDVAFFRAAHAVQQSRVRGSQVSHTTVTSRMRTRTEKMLAGELYDPLDAELCTDRRRARLLFQGVERHPRRPRARSVRA